MPGPRRRLFGPLFYSTLVGAALVLLYVGALQVPGWFDDGWRSIAERQEIRNVTQATRSPDATIRELAVRHLIAKGPEVCRPILVEMARAPDDEVRGLAFRLLSEGNVDPSEALGLLIEAAGDRYDPARIYAAEGMGRFAGLSTAGRREAARRALRKLLKDPSTGVRISAAGALGTFGPDPEIAADLVGALRDEDRSVRLAAAGSLIRINGPDDPSAARALIEMAAVPEPVSDRRDVLREIGRMSPPVRDRAAGALAVLVRAADSEILADLLAAIAEAATWARAVEPALEPLLDHKEPDIRARAALAIVAIECPEAAQGLKVGSPGTTGGPGAGSMGFASPEGPSAGPQLGPKAGAILARVVGDGMIPRELRMNAAILIRSAGAPAITRATPPLVRQLADPDPAVRAVALGLLGELLIEAPASLPPEDPSK